MNDYNNSEAKLTKERPKRPTLIEAHSNLIHSLHDLNMLRDKSDDLVLLMKRTTCEGQIEGEDIQEPRPELDIVDMFMILSNEIDSNIKHIFENIDTVEKMIE